MMDEWITGALSPHQVMLTNPAPCFRHVRERRARVRSAAVPAAIPNARQRPTFQECGCAEVWTAAETDGAPYTPSEFFWEDLSFLLFSIVPFYYAV
jgi:hypothetical protein